MPARCFGKISSEVDKGKVMVTEDRKLPSARWSWSNSLASSSACGFLVSALGALLTALPALQFITLRPVLDDGTAKKERNRSLVMCDRQCAMDLCDQLRPHHVPREKCGQPIFQ